MIADEQASASAFANSAITSILCYPIDLFPIYQDLARRTLPLNKGHLPHAVNDKYKVLPANVEIIQAAEELINIERVASLRFLYLYCLGIDNVYFFQAVGLHCGYE